VAKVTLERLKKIPLTKTLDEGLIRELLARVQEIPLEQGDVLVEPGRPDLLLYFVEEGKMAVTEVDPSGRQQIQRQVKRGEYLGSYTLVTGRPSQVTASAVEDTMLLAIPLDKLHPLLLPGIQQKRLKRDKVLFRQGDPPDFVYFIEKGKVAEVRVVPTGRGRVHRHAEQGDYVGRRALLTGQPFELTAIAEEETTLLAIPLRYLQRLMFAHDDWHSWFFRTDVAARMRAVPLFRDLGDWDVYRLADAVEVREYEAGDKADSFYIVDQGQVTQEPSPTSQAQKGGPQYFAAGNYFGRHGLIQGQGREATAIAQKPTRLFRIPERTLRDLLQERAQDLPKDLARVDLRARLQEIPLFSSLSHDNLRLLTGYVSLEYHRSGDIVARQGQPATSLMILEEGEAVVRLQVGKGQPRPVTYLKAHRGAAPSTWASRLESNYFGAHALLADEMRGATVEVTQPSVWIVLNRDDFKQFLADADLSTDDLEQALQSEAQVGARPVLPEDELPHKVRRHWIILVMRILPLLVIMILVAAAIMAGLASNLSGGPQNALLWGGGAFLLLLALWTVYRVADWWNDTYEVTSKAVIHTEKTLFLSEERYEIPLRQIQNVNIFVPIVGRWLDFGDVGIDTAAQTGQINFTTIPEPAYVQELIQRASVQARSGLQIQRRESIRQQLEDQFFPERLKPSTPRSVLIQPEPEPEQPARGSRFRTPRGWLPRFEIREGDRIIWRKHWINLLQRTGIQFFVFLLAAYLLFSFALAFVTESFGLTPVLLPPVSWVSFQGWLFLTMLVLAIPASLWFIYQYVDWRNDVYIVTDDEVIDVERQLAIFPFFFIFTESRRQASLANVQYVDLRIPHPIAMVLNYGHVIVQTAGAEGTLDFLFVSNPRRVHAEVLRRLAAFQERARERELQERWRDMPQWFDTYQDIVGQSGPQRG
jgi:CRP-like cAMP-binding protein/membrane protein YdbS with pleckstrin-like domain